MPQHNFFLALYRAGKTPQHNFFLSLYRALFQYNKTTMENNPTIIEVTFDIMPGDRLAELVRKGILETIAKQYADQCIVYKDYRASSQPTYCVSFPNAEDALAFQLKHGSDLEQLRHHRGPSMQLYTNFKSIF